MKGIGVASGCGEKEAGVASGSGWNLWMWLLGVVVRRYNYRFPHTTYPYSSCICSFLQQHPHFLLIFKMFFVLVPVLFVITFYVLNNFFVQCKHIRATTSVPRQPYEGCTYCFIHEEAHTNVRFISCHVEYAYESRDSHV